MVLYCYSGKDAMTGKPVYIRCEIIEDHENYVIAKSLNTGHKFTAPHMEFCLILTSKEDCIVY